MSKHRALEHAEKAHKLAQEGSYSPAIQEVVLAIRELCMHRIDKDEARHCDEWIRRELKELRETINRPCTFEGTPTTAEYLRSLPVDECGLCSITQRLARDIANRLDELAHLKDHWKEGRRFWLVGLGDCQPYQVWFTRPEQLPGMRECIEVMEQPK